MNSLWGKDIVNSQFPYHLVLLLDLHLPLPPNPVPQRTKAEKDLTQLKKPQIKQETKLS
jgi:hypothetical protein